MPIENPISWESAKCQEKMIAPAAMVAREGAQEFADIAVQHEEAPAGRA
jgi:hypothetical protein